MNTMHINVNSIKCLIPYAYGAVVHFCRTSARLYGKLAFREQLNYENQTGVFSSFDMVETDRAELKREIVRLASSCATSIQRLNAIARKHNILEPMASANSMSLTELITAVVDYVETLVAESDYKSWLEEVK